MERPPIELAVSGTLVLHQKQKPQNSTTPRSNTEVVSLPPIQSPVSSGALEEGQPAGSTTDPAAPGHTSPELYRPSPVTNHASLFPNDSSNFTLGLPGMALPVSVYPSSPHPSQFPASFPESLDPWGISHGRENLSSPYYFHGSIQPRNLSYSSPEDSTEDRGKSDENLEQTAAQQAEDGNIIVDSYDTATDAGYSTGSDISASTSLSESVSDFVYENGRRYHSFREGRYNFPNDDVEQQREDLKHMTLKMLCGRLHFAPIGDSPQEVLDIGTGTGIWAIEIGDLFPGASVLGVDLSPIQPSWVPPNVRFMVDDVESKWLHPANYFDYIHSRHTVMAIKNWPRLMKRSLKHLRPGGWFELQEVHHCPISANGTMAVDHPVAEYWRLINDGLANLGINFHAVSEGRLTSMMRTSGFVNVTERVFQIPIGTWPKDRVLKDVGQHWRSVLLDGVQAIALGPLTRGCGWTREEVELLLVQVRKAYYDNSCLMYMPLHVIYGQKPQDG